MPKVLYRIAVPVILAGIFVITVFIALDYNQLSPIFYFILIFLAIYVFSFGFVTGQSFASPIKKLLDEATNLSEGKLSSRVYLETKDELAELAQVFNKIAENLQNSQTQEDNMEKSVDMKVRARTQALEETINALEQKVRNRTAELEKMIKDTEVLQGSVKNIQPVQQAKSASFSVVKKPRLRKSKRSSVQES